jgi:glycosyltransferase involved in cell wall biosynthesis
MRVLLVHSRYRSATPSGENRVVDQESEELARAGHEVRRFEKDSDEIEHWSAARKALLPARVVWSRESHRELAATLRAYRPDVVHVHNTFPLVSAAVLYACRNASVPVVATLHNYRLMCAPGDFMRQGAVCHDCMDTLPVRGVVHGCYRGSRAATAPLVVANIAHRKAWRSLVSAYSFISAAQRDLHVGLRLPPSRVFVRHNMVPYRGIQPVPREPVVAYVGRLEENKGVRLLMTAWDRYLASSGDPGLRLVIAGAGSLDREVAGWAAARPSVDMLGLIPAAQVRDLMSRARAVLAPSVWEEPFGLVVVEAMAAGTPAIASGHGSFTELVTPGTDGVLFRPGDPDALAGAVADVAAHPEKYESYGRRARESYEQKFNPDNSLKHLLEIYSFAMTYPVWGPAVVEQMPDHTSLGGLQRCNRICGAGSPRHRLAGVPRCRCGPWPWRVTTLASSDGRSTGWCTTARDTTTPTTWRTATWISSAGSWPRSPGPRSSRSGPGWRNWTRTRTSEAS